MMVTKIVKWHDFEHVIDENGNVLVVDVEENKMVKANWNDVTYLVNETYDGFEWQKKAQGKPTKKFKNWANELFNDYLELKGGN